MRLTAFTDYGLRILMRMAANPDRGHSTAALADEFGLSRHHLAKIVQKLVQGGILQTRRGGGGGASLAQPANQITLGQIVRLLEEGQPLVECFATGKVLCSIDGHCRLKTRLRQAESAFLATLNTSTLADVALKPIGG